MRPLFGSRSLGRLPSFTAAALALLLVVACGEDRAETYEPAAPMPAAPNTLSAADSADGWHLLFDGESFAGWRGIGSDSVPADHWVIEDGAIHKVASGNVPLRADGQPAQGGDLMTVDTFEHFELTFEWKVDSASNSGIKYNVSEEMSMTQGGGNALGFEYQILDSAHHPDAKTERGATRVAGALYDIIAPSDSVERPVGEYNEGKIVFNGNHGEHWLNGVLVVEYDMDSPRFDSLFATSKYTGIENFAEHRDGHIVLQDHNDNAWFRNIKIRELTPATSPQ